MLVFCNEGQTSRTVNTLEKERDQEHEWQGDPEKDIYKEKEKSEKVSALNSKEGASHKATTFSNKEKYNLCKPISELDLSHCQRCTPSYRLLPKNVSSSDSFYFMMMSSMSSHVFYISFAVRIAICEQPD